MSFTRQPPAPSTMTPQAINDLTGRVALVTGGGTGIGLMITQGLAAANAKVYITGRRLDVLEKIAKEYDGTFGGQIVPCVDPACHQRLLIIVFIEFRWMLQIRRASLMLKR